MPKNNKLIKKDTKHIKNHNKEKCKNLLINSILKYLVCLLLGLLSFYIRCENYEIIIIMQDVPEEELNNIINNFESLQKLYLEYANIKILKFNNIQEYYNDKNIYSMKDIENKLHKTDDEIKTTTHEMPIINKKTKKEKKIKKEMPIIKEEIKTDKFSDEFIEKFKNDMYKLNEILLNYQKQIE